MQLMKKMLNKSPDDRLWKLQEFKNDEFFEDFDCNKLISLTMPPPYKVKFKEIIEKNETNTYLNYIDTRGVKKTNKKASDRQLRFEKWLKNF